jgi:hypothetical protein
VHARAAADLLAGIPLGFSSGKPVEPDRLAADPWVALEQAVLPALARPPAVVAFSGGVDSSLVLAAATSAARAHGLPDPVPATICFPSAPWTAETDWQEPLIASLHLADWERIDLDQELDLLGDVAIGILVRHGPYWPANAHSMVPLARLASAGTLVSGMGGDDVLREWRWRRRSAFVRQLSGLDILEAAKSWRLLPTTILGSLPAPLRRRALEQRSRRARRHPDQGEYSWLTDDGRELIRPGLVEKEDQPVRWDQFVRWVDRRRTTEAYRQALHAVAGEAGAEVCSPLISRGFLEALAGVGGRVGYPDRAAAVTAIARGRLPAPTGSRATKAGFHEVFWGPRARAFAESWDGYGVDDRLVDVAALRHEWLSECPDFRSMWMLHGVWLAQEAAPSGGRACL